MTIPKGIEECDLIAPGLLPCPFCGQKATHVIGGPKHARYVMCSMCNATTAMRDSPELAAADWNARAGFAAGQAHPQWRGEPVAWRRLHVLDEDATMWRLRSTPPPGCGWEPLYAAPAASQAAPVAVAEPNKSMTEVAFATREDAGPETEPVLLASTSVAHAKADKRSDGRSQAQEPDALVRRSREIADKAKYRHSDADRVINALCDRVEQLQAQHEADAARIAELWRHNCDLAQRMNDLHGERTIAEAARDEALSGLAEAERLLRDVPDDDPGSIVWTRIRVFLARPLILAQADARSDKGAKP